MKDIYRFSSATKQPEISGDTLIDFLVQCDIQGAYFQFPPSMDRRQLKALTHPLDPKYFEATSTVSLNPNAFFTAMNHQDQQPFPCQVCRQCAPSLFKHYGDNMVGSNWCSQCHEQKDCLDVALIEHYRKRGIHDETICHQLPKSRWGSCGAAYQSFEDIEAAYQPLFEAARKNMHLRTLDQSPFDDAQHLD